MCTVCDAMIGRQRGASGPTCLSVMFKRQCHYNSLFGRLEADQCKLCELQRSATAPTLCLPDVMHMFSPLFCLKSGGRNILGRKLA